MRDNVISAVESYVKHHQEPEIGNGFSHVDRVRGNALLIARTERYADLEAVQVAALLHDIGRTNGESKIDHGGNGARIADEFLAHHTNLSKEKIEEICNAIRHHNKNRIGEGKLLDILRDADILDLLGAIGIMRACARDGVKPEFTDSNIKGETWNLTSKGFDERLDSGLGKGPCLVDEINFEISCFENLRTETAKRIAGPAVEFSRRFLLELEREIAKNQS
jgi:uncharacterized protein